MYRLVLVIHNVRSAHNVGSMLRTAEGFGLEKIYLTGYTPYPVAKNDSRLPHVSSRTSKKINKTALNAENFVEWEFKENAIECLKQLGDDGFFILALEQTKGALNLNLFNRNKDIALIVGSEIGGIDKVVLNEADQHVQIPMSGRKESFNVAVAAGIAIFYLRYS
jgi:23S rRNA (guanosine2251-2'-O)-methyltransferase